MRNFTCDRPLNCVAIRPSFLSGRWLSAKYHRLSHSMGKNMSLLSNNFDLFCKLRLTFQQAAAEEQVYWIWCNYYIITLRWTEATCFLDVLSPFPPPFSYSLSAMLQAFFNLNTFVRWYSGCSCWLILQYFTYLKLTWAGDSWRVSQSSQFVSWAGCRGLHAASRWWPGCQRCGPGWGALDGINAILMWQNVTKGHAMSCSCDACGSRNQKTSILAI